MTGSTPASGDDIKKLWGMIKDIGVTMMTTVDDDGTCAAVRWSHSSRNSMATSGSSPGSTPQGRRGQGTPSGQPQLRRPGQPELRFDFRHRQIVRDKQKVHELWSEPLATWFPKGKDDPNIGLIRVHVDKAEYWDSPSSTMVHAYGYVKANLTGEPPTPAITRSSTCRAFLWAAPLTPTIFASAAGGLRSV